MYDIVKLLHSSLAFLVIFALIVAVLDSFMGMNSRKGFTSKNRKIALTALILSHSQFLLGIIIYFVSPFGISAFGQMSDSTLRLTSLEHPLVVILGLSLITIGWSKHKKLVSSELKFKTILIYYALGLVLIASRIPWDSWINNFIS